MATTPDYEGFRAAATKKYPKYAKEINSFIEGKQREELVRRGSMDVTELQKTDPGGALRLLQEGVKPKVELSAEESKQKQKLSDLTNSLDVLEQNFGQVEAKGPISGRGAGLISKLTSGAVYGQIADYESLRKGMIGPVARAISGEVGVLTDKDVARAENLLPKVSDDPTLAQRKLNNLRDLISRKGGTGPLTGKEPQLREGTGNPLTDAITQNPILNFLLGTSANVAQDIGTGIRSRMERGNLKKLESQAQQLEAAGDYGNANKIRSMISQEAGDISKSFSPEVGGNPLIRGLLSGVQIASVAEIPAFLKSTWNIGGKVLHPFRSVGEMRAAAISEASGKTISGNKIVSALEKGVEDVSPTAEAGYRRFLDIAKGKYTGKELSVEQAVKLNSAANDAFTAAGKVGKASTAKFNKILGDVLKGELKINAPAVSKANELFKFLYKSKDVTKRFAPPAIIGGAASYGGYKLMKELMGGQ